MPVTSLIVEATEASCEDLLKQLALVPRVNVFGMKGQQIVTVVEGETAGDVQAVVKRIQELDGVIGVYPVYAGDYE